MSHPTISTSLQLFCSTPSPSLTLVMPTIGWEEPCGFSLRAALAGLGPQDEALVVFDGQPPPAPEWLIDSPARLLHTGRRSGPAAARNLAARQARGDILLFVDADVELHADALERVRAHFTANPDLAAVFGSYDDKPAAAGVVSRFRNLLHHHTHQCHPGPASSFWAGCGAVRREVFLNLGGFDSDIYDRPCIEDIEFGLRLSDAGGLILLDPTIQGTHHKRWTLRSMVSTDIRQRAIPWSKLLLQRRELPATLNLDPAARLSAAASLIFPLVLFVSLLPAVRYLALAMLGVCLALLLLLNRDFYLLMVRRCGLAEALAGMALHMFYLAYSSLVLALMTLIAIARHPARLMVSMRCQPVLCKRLVGCAILMLAVLAFVAISKGLYLGWHLPNNDINQRWQEWQLFSQRIYPSWQLAGPVQRKLPYFRTTVYLPWALPLFAPLFTGAGKAQGIAIIHITSLLSLTLFAAIGWFRFRRWGRSAGWLAALAPLAISGNSNALAHGQFSIVCMGLVTLQWLFLKHNQVLPAGFFWALAMVKPQIAATYAASFLGPRRLLGLLLGLAMLLGLAAGALVYTRVPLTDLLAAWLKTLPDFVGVRSLNFLSVLMSLGSGLDGTLAIWIVSACLIVPFLIFFQPACRAVSRASRLVRSADPLLLAGLCGIVGIIAFYHRNYDNIMLYPALLASFHYAFLKGRVLDVFLAGLVATSLWTPQRLLEAWPGSDIAQVVIWCVLGVCILTEIIVQSPAEILSPPIRNARL